MTTCIFVKLASYINCLSLKINQNYKQISQKILILMLTLGIYNVFICLIVWVKRKWSCSHWYTFSDILFKRHFYNWNGLVKTLLGGQN